MAYQMDFFAGIESKVLAAIESSKVQYPAYVFVRDEEASETGRLAFVDQNNVLKFIRGENKQQVVTVTELPKTGDTEVLYILNGVVHTFDGAEFKAQFVDHSAELDALDSRVTAIETKVADLETANATLVEQITELEKTVDELEASSGGGFIELE